MNRVRIFSKQNGTKRDLEEVKYYPYQYQNQSKLPFICSSDGIFALWKRKLLATIDSYCGVKCLPLEKINNWSAFKAKYRKRLSGIQMWINIIYKSYFLPLWISWGHIMKNINIIKYVSSFSFLFQCIQM